MQTREILAPKIVVQRDGFGSRRIVLGLIDKSRRRISFSTTLRRCVARSRFDAGFVADRALMTPAGIAASATERSDAGLPK